MTAQRVLPGPEGSRFSSIEHVEQTGSTNADLLERAATGEGGWLVRVTDHQTAGRGRRSRAWHDDPGNAMLMSVLLHPHRTVAPLIPLLTGLAVTDAAETVIGGDGPLLALKWPNDVLAPGFDERKVCGILAEAITVPNQTGDSDRPDLVVVAGIGCNIRWSTPPPTEIAVRAATLEEVAGVAVDRWALVSAVLAALDAWLSVADAEGPSPVLDEYRHRCITIGRHVRLERPADVIEGMAIAVGDDGALVVETADGPLEVTAGDAHHV